MFANLRWTSQVSIATCHFLSRLLKLLAAGTPEAAAELTCPNGLRETARLRITVHCYPLNAGLTGTAQEGNEDDEKAR